MELKRFNAAIENAKSNLFRGGYYSGCCIALNDWVSHRAVYEFEKHYKRWWHFGVFWMGPRNMFFLKRRKRALEKFRKISIKKQLYIKY